MELEIKVFVVEYVGSGMVILEVIMYLIDLFYVFWLIRFDVKFLVGELESCIIIDFMYLGCYLGISDFMVVVFC